MKTVEQTQAFRILEQLESEGALQANPQRARQIILGLVRRLGAVLPPEGKTWLAVAEAYSRGQATAGDLERVRVDAWQHLGDESSNFSSPSVNAVRALICGLFPDEPTESPFDSLTNALGFYLGANGNPDDATAVIQEAFK